MTARLPHLLLLTPTLFISPLQAAQADPIWRVDSVDTEAVKRYRKNNATVMGRVTECRDTADMSYLILDGGALYISMVIANGRIISPKLKESVMNWKSPHRPIFRTC